MVELLAGEAGCVVDRQAMAAVSMLVARRSDKREMAARAVPAQSEKKAPIGCQVNESIQPRLAGSIPFFYPLQKSLLTLTEGALASPCNRQPLCRSCPRFEVNSGSHGLFPESWPSPLRPLQLENTPAGDF